MINQKQFVFSGEGHIVHNQARKVQFNQFLVNKRVEIQKKQKCGYQSIANSYSTSITNIVRTGSSEQTLKSLLEEQENCKQKVFDECSSCKKRTELIQMSQLKGNYVYM